MATSKPNLTERTLVIFKSDVLPRGLFGKILTRFENAGFKLVGAKMIKPTRELLENHYNGDMEWVTNLGRKTISTFETAGKSVKDLLGTDDPEVLGKDVKEQLIDYLLDKPVVVTVWEGSAGTIGWIRKLVGYTVPATAEVGSIRSDFSHDSQLSAPFKNRAINNLLHASGNAEEAESEIKVWFGEDFKPFKYIRTDEIFF
jgi:nucleoside-diphosphate kinase